MWKSKSAEEAKLSNRDSITVIGRQSLLLRHDNVFLKTTKDFANIWRLNHFFLLSLQHHSQTKTSNNNEESNIPQRLDTTSTIRSG